MRERNWTAGLGFIAGIGTGLAAGISWALPKLTAAHQAQTETTTSLAHLIVETIKTVGQEVGNTIRQSLVPPPVEISFQPPGVQESPSAYEEVLKNEAQIRNGRATPNAALYHDVMSEPDGWGDAGEG